MSYFDVITSYCDVILSCYDVIISLKLISYNTGCPAVGDNFDTPLFSELGALIREIFGLVIVHDLTFHLVYNSAPYLEYCIGDHLRHFR